MRAIKISCYIMFSQLTIHSSHTVLFASLPGPRRPKEKGIVIWTCGGGVPDCV